MKLQLDEGSLEVFVAILNAASKLMEDIRVFVEPDKVWFRGMDPAHIAMVDAELREDFFTSIEAGAETNFDILLEKICQFLKKPQGTGLLSLEERGLSIQVKGNYEKRFLVPLLGRDSEDPPFKLPKVDFTTNVKVATTALKEAAAGVSLVAEKVVITTKDKVIEFGGQSDEGAESMSRFAFGDVDILEAESSQDDKAVYNVKFIQEIVRALEKVSGFVEVSYSQDLPLKLSFDFTKPVKFDFYLAPRIEEGL